MLSKTQITLLLCILSYCLAGDIIVESKEDSCRVHNSCSVCLTKKTCTWCVTKSRCTHQACGNDNVIYPGDVAALMSGPAFCPRVDESKQLLVKSGKREIVSVKITQIYLYMAFTPWKCKLILNGKEKVVPAVLVADHVYCESMEFVNESELPITSGSVVVMWDYNKSFDGALNLSVCRCDLAPNCSACTK